MAMGPLQEQALALPESNNSAMDRRYGAFRRRSSCGGSLSASVPVSLLVWLLIILVAAKTTSPTAPLRLVQPLAKSGRDALRQLFGGDRLRVRPDAEGGVAIEGTAILELGMQCQGGAGDPVRPLACTHIRIPLAA